MTLPKAPWFRPVHDAATLRALGVPQAVLEAADACGGQGCGCGGQGCGRAEACGCGGCSDGRGGTSHRPPRLSVVEALLLEGAARPLNVLVAPGTRDLVTRETPVDFLAKKREEKEKKRKNDEPQVEPPPESRVPQGPVEETLEEVTVYAERYADLGLEAWDLLWMHEDPAPLAGLGGGAGPEAGAPPDDAPDDDVAEEITVTAPGREAAWMQEWVFASSWLDYVTDPPRPPRPRRFGGNLPDCNACKVQKFRCYCKGQGPDDDEPLCREYEFTCYVPPIAQVPVDPNQWHECKPKRIECETQNSCCPKDPEVHDPSDPTSPPPPPPGQPWSSGFDPVLVAGTAALS